MNKEELAKQLNESLMKDFNGLKINPTTLLALKASVNLKLQTLVPELNDHLEIKVSQDASDPRMLNVQFMPKDMTGYNFLLNEDWRSDA